MQKQDFEAIIQDFQAILQVQLQKSCAWAAFSEKIPKFFVGRPLHTNEQFVVLSSRKRRVRKSHGGENLVSPGKLDAGGQVELKGATTTTEGKKA